MSKENNGKTRIGLVKTVMSALFISFVVAVIIIQVYGIGYLYRQHTEKVDAAVVDEVVKHEHCYDYSAIEAHRKCEEVVVYNLECECGEILRVEIKPSGHDYRKEYISDCGERRVKLTCKDCDHEEVYTVIGVDEHKWIETYRAEPTCIVDGEVGYTCEDCGLNKVHTLFAEGHDWGDSFTVEAATCEHTGLARRMCRTCGMYTKEEQTPILECNVEDGKCVDCGREVE